MANDEVIHPNNDAIKLIDHALADLRGEYERLIAIRNKTGGDYHDRDGNFIQHSTGYDRITMIMDQVARKMIKLEASRQILLEIYTFKDKQS